MEKKVVFVDRSRLTASVVKILARNIVAKRGNTIKIQVMHINDVEKGDFRNVQKVLVDPALSMAHPVINQIPRSVCRETFHIPAYASMDTEGIIEQIEQKENDHFRLSFK